MDPYAPPEAKLVPPPSRAEKNALSRARLILGMSAAQLCCLAWNARVMGRMIANGETSVLVGLLAMVSCLFLYRAAIRFVLDRSGGRIIFLLAAAGLLASWYSWSHRYGGSHFDGPWVLFFGATIAICGALSVQPRVPAGPPAS